jgi:ribosomal 50S subunit-associated protein YjgA (DUF615 family)
MRKLRDHSSVPAKSADEASRSARRREALVREEALEQLARDLVALKPKQIERLALDDELLESVVHARSLEDRRARHRQIGVVRQQLRGQDERVLALRARVDALRGIGDFPRLPPPPEPAVVRPAVSEWAERLVVEGDAALTEFLALHPGADRQALRRAARAVARSREAGEGGASVGPAELRLREAIEPWV